ncbi:MAG: transglutaminase-like domain-containing protein [Nitrospinae bacterium]|jgi:regulator of sirC expression with transglutaminase-like and TPR domain|nr:transglutaminase-like domain-containing protein [Nitrospinota bacterium]MDA1110729.1 transglutaminase-like domain-containing protein [Nitrospinota bacterium]
MTVPNDNNQVSHLIRLIDDRDEFVRTKVREQLIHIGEDALPFLQIATRTENLNLRALASEIIQAILPGQLGEKFRQLVLSARGGDIDLEQGVIFLMQFRYPGTGPEKIPALLDKIAEKLGSRLNPDDSPQQVVQQMTRLLFIEEGFAGNDSSYTDPDNSYFNKVLERKTGIPITLSALCLLIARRLHLPIVGVGLPGHYIVKYASATDPIYFDPFHQGRILQRKDCIRLVESVGHQFEEHHLSQATHRETLVRMMNNLVAAYDQTNELEKSRHLKEYINILLGSPRSFPANSP